MNLERVIQKTIEAITEADVRGNSLKPGFTIDLSELVPQDIKAFVIDILSRRMWEPIDGIKISSRRAIWPIYRGVSDKGYHFFDFPDDLSIKIDKVIIRRLDFNLTGLLIKEDFSEAILCIAFWPDIVVRF